MNVMRHTAGFVVNQITVNNFADLFNCMPGLSSNDDSGIKLSLKSAGVDDLSLVGPTGVQLLDFTAAGVVPCGGRKTSPRTSSIVQFIFWSFEISDNILRNQK